MTENPTKRPHESWQRAALALGLGVLVVAVVLTLAIIGVAPWLSFAVPGEEQADGPAPAAATSSGPALAGASAAEQVVRRVADVQPEQLKEWRRLGSSAVTTSSFGLGCDPVGDIAPAIARTVNWYDEKSGRSLAVQVAAYPAGGGSVALQAADAVASDPSCSGVYTSTGLSELGVDATELTSSRTVAQLWRRGDVVVTASARTSDGPEDPGSHEQALRELDRVLADALVGVCANPEGESSRARSPYLDRANYHGRQVTEKVERGDMDVPSPTPPSGAQKVPVPAPDLPIPAVPERPATPQPLPTEGPVALPEYQYAPAAPDAPTRPPMETTAPKRIPDPVGPGCGWDFTGQQPPHFDQEKADAELQRAVDRARGDLRRQWRAWPGEQADYFGEYAAYRAAVEDYEVYAAEVSEVASAWNVIWGARNRYYAALDSWRGQQQARRTFFDRQEAARQRYRQAVRDCERRKREAEQEAQEPSDDPSASGSASAEPEPEPEPKPVRCDPKRPGILGDSPPTVGSSPVPDPEAQLPAGSGR